MKAVLVALVILCGVSQAIAQYNVIDLGTLGGTISEAYGLNNNGQVVGWSYTTGLTRHAFLYSGGIMTDLGTLGKDSTAEAINDNGQVAGWSYKTTTPHAFFYNGTTMLDLGTLGGTTSMAFGLNNSGQVIGWAYTTGSTVSHAFCYNGGMTDLGISSSDSGGHDINDSGQIIGSMRITGSSALHAFLYDGSTIDLGSLGGTSGEAIGVNNSGQVVGYSDITNTPHAFLYDGTMIDIGTLGTSSEAWGINDNGQIVGTSYTGTAHHAFVYNSTMTDLNNLIDPSLGWTLTYAQAINNNGQIAGWGVNKSGQTHAFLLTPNSEVYWNNTNGSWGTGNKWNPSKVPQLGDKAVFANSIFAHSSYTITLDGNRVVSGLRFNGYDYTINAGSAPSTLIIQTPDNVPTTIDALSGSNAINVPLVLDCDLAIHTAPGAVMTTGAISGDDSKTLTVDGDLTVDSICIGTVTITAGSTLTIAPIPGGYQMARPVPEPSTYILILTLGLWSLYKRHRMSEV